MIDRDVEESFKKLTDEILQKEKDWWDANINRLCISLNMIRFWICLQEIVEEKHVELLNDAIKIREKKYPSDTFEEILKRR